MLEEREPDGDAAPSEPEDVFYVWPENVPVLGLFAALQRRWNVAAGMGGVFYLGLDASWIKLIFWKRRVPLADRERLLDELIDMEGGALKVLNRRDG